MKNAYPTGPVPTDPNDLMFLGQVNLGMIKTLVDQNGIQCDLTMKTDGLRLTLIKKYGKQVQRQTVDIDNGEYSQFQSRFMSALAKLNMMGW